MEFTAEEVEELRLRRAAQAGQFNAADSAEKGFIGQEKARAPSFDRSAIDAGAVALDSLLTTLRKHGVIEYNRDQFGTRVKFEPKPSPTGFAAMLDQEIAKQTLEDKLLGKIPTIDDQPLRVEPVGYDLEDILPSGGQ